MIFSIIINVSKSMLQNKYVKDFQRDNTDCLIFNTLISIVSLITIYASAGSRVTFTKELLLAGMLLGLFTALGFYFTSQALITGSMSYTVFIASTAMIIPVIAGTAVWKDPISAIQIAGMLVLISSFYLGVETRKKEKISWQWIISCTIMFVSNGMIGVMQKIQQQSSFREETNSFLVIVFIFASVFISMPVLLSKNRRNILTFGKKSYLFAFGGGVGYAVINIINLYLVGKMPSSVFFPAYNGSVILATTIAGALFFKEKLSIRQYISILAGIIGVILVNI
jgi:drug/metabolite transporter (DMT)-like permease